MAYGYEKIAKILYRGEWMDESEARERGIWPIVEVPTHVGEEMECDHAVTLAHLYDTQDLTYGRDWKKDDEELREQGKL